ncbi:MAG: hypothetical protein NVSMB64_21720 [Candidatus Velthaea sp.]
MALAIVLDGFAFILWDVGTRPPLTLARDLVAGARSSRIFSRALGRFLIGLTALSIAAAVTAPVIARFRDLTIIEFWTLIAGLLVEQLVGPDIRARIARRRSTG